MASSPLQPSTPTETPRRMAMNRSFTVPAKLSTAPKTPSASAEIGATEGVETLFTYANASIVKFTSSSRPISSSASPGRPGSSQGILPWTSPTERPMAAGPMEIYRVPGSVSFLHSGALLHAILPRSNCWCVDGVSKFALRVLPDTYYRIELPGKTAEDLQAVEKLKVTLQKVLFYERTPCPFARTFDVDLPEEVEVRKKRRKSSGPAKKWKLQNGSSWRPDGWVAPEEGGEESGSGSSIASDDEDGSDDEGKGASSELADEVRSLNVTSPTRPRMSSALRSVTSPMPAPAQSSTPSKLRTRVDVDGTVEAIERAEMDGTQPETPKTRTLQAIPTHMPPSPPDSSAGQDYVESQGLTRGSTVDGRTRDADVPGDEHTTAGAPQDADAHTATLVQNVVSSSAPATREPTAEEPTAANASTTDVISSNQAIIAMEPEDERVLPSIGQGADESPLTADERVLPSIEQDADEGPLTTDEPEATTFSPKEPLSRKDAIDDRPVTPEAQITADDPYAAIQARILARRSIGGTTTFYPGRKSPTRASSSSTSSTATIASNASAVSRRSQSSQRQQAFASAMVKKACAVFLGPPARLVAIMLRIAARYADAAFGVNSMFYVESPIDSPRVVPGSYHLESDDLEDLDSEWEEDDFGVPLRSPVRLVGKGAGSDGLMRERRGWDVD